MPWKPDQLVLMVYLVNDLFDNQLARSLQVKRTKPYFVLGKSGLELMNAPDLFGASNPGNHPTLLDMLFGERAEDATMRQRWEGQSHLFRRFSETCLPAARLDAAFVERQDYAVRLCWALIERIQQDCTTNGTQFILALMSGKSYVESPACLSAQFQDFFRRRIVEGAATRKIALIDVAQTLQNRYADEHTHWFHRNEGHLNAEGHGIVAEILEGGLRDAEFLK
jgi:hypothetical protein